ncbi:cohesin subunit SA 1 [Trichuris trichiura]|uniref:Cohesin subunit SA 1 n=1 Tax=Trichuris trichiura TaxID=36087 RepID=A0A077Z5T2_TRITR|nr:cohesin subunit SA 1 [Trichuris trichiura]
MTDSPSNSSPARPMRLAKQGAIESISSFIGAKSRSPSNTSSRISDRDSKRSLANSSSESVAKRGRLSSVRGRPRGRPPRQPSAPVDTTASLFSLVRDGKASLVQVADDWIENYMSDREVAVMDLLQYFISSCGCKGVVSLDMIQSSDFILLVRRMTEDFDEESVDYPLILTGSHWRRFRQNFCDFITTLVRQCQYSIIYDQYMMDSVISLLTHLADSHARAFRHTATLAAMKMVTALAEIAVRLDQSLSSVTQQFENERSRQRKSNQRLEALQQKKQEYTENKDEIVNMIEYLFQCVFVQRYKDVVPDIRCICVTELGVWMLSYPEHFLVDARLKYIGWTLYDKVGEVRMKCLKTLLPLYEEEQFTSNLKMFTPKFKTRLLSMVLDREPENGVLAIKILMKIYKQADSDSLPLHIECDTIYACVYAAHRGLALTAGEFFLLDLTSATGRKRKVDVRNVLFKLVDFHIRSNIHTHTAFLVDALFESCDYVRNWSAMTDLLLLESSEENRALDERGESTLIDIMAFSVKQASTGEPPAGRTVSKKYITQREHRQWLEDQERITEHFAMTLPQLLHKFVVNTQDVINLLTIAQYFHMNVYAASVYSNPLESLLKCIEELFAKHTDEEVLANCSKTYECLCSGQLPVHVRSVVTRSKIIDSTVLKFREDMQNFNANLGKVDDEDFASTLASLRRVEALYQCHDLSKWKIWDMAFPLIRNSDAYARPIDHNLVVLATRTCFWILLWDLLAIENGNLEEEAISSLKQRLGELVTCCRTMILSNMGEVAGTAYLVLCDLLLIFGWTVGQEIAELKTLIFIVKPDLEDELQAFLGKWVFCSDQTDIDRNDPDQIEILRKRRSFLASYSKLIVWSVLSIRSATEVFKNYAEYYNDYGEIIKMTIAKCREKDKIACARSMTDALCSLYQKLCGNVPPEERADNLAPVRELIRRFGTSMGTDLIRCRELVVMINRCGIIFASQRDGPDLPNIHFLEVLSETCNKLLPQDKKLVLQYLNEAFGFIEANDDDRFRPLVMFKEVLSLGDEEQRTTAAASTLVSNNDSTMQSSAGKRPRNDDSAGTPRSVSLSTLTGAGGREINPLLEVDEMLEDEGDQSL